MEGIENSEQVNLLREQLEYTIRLLGKWKERANKCILELQEDLDSLENADIVLSKKCTPDLFGCACKNQNNSK